MRIFDCSNSSERPPHRSESFGPKQNDVMRYLRMYANEFGVEYVDDPLLSDIIITNDVFPSYIAPLKKKKVKRMDGIYWDEDNVNRNVALNRAASQADLVIFISKYSQQSHRQLYGNLKSKNVVILNQVDDCVFNKISKSYKPTEKFVWTASVSNWARHEKRFNSMMDFAKLLNKDSVLQLIGNCDMDVPSNVLRLGYMKNPMEMAEVLLDSHAFVNFSYRDAASKTVCQAVNCGLPVLYADSGGTGGTGEIVKHGVGIKDTKDIVFEDTTSDLDVVEIKKSYNDFLSKYDKMVVDIKSEPICFKEMIEAYFENCRLLLD